MIRKSRYVILTAIFILTPTCKSMSDAIEAYSLFPWEEISSKTLIIPGLLFASRLSSIIAHELGHALPAKLFKNRPIDIHIGADQRTRDMNEKIFSIGGASFYKGIFHPKVLNYWIRGFAFTFNDPHTNEAISYTNRQLLTIHAGGAAAQCTLGCLFFYFYKKTENPFIYSFLLSQALSNWSQCLYSLDPKNSLDGLNVFRLIKIQEKYKNQIPQLAIALSFHEKSVLGMALAFSLKK